MLIFGGPIALWWAMSIYRFLAGDTAKHSMHATSTLSKAWGEHLEQEIKEHEKATRRRD